MKNTEGVKMHHHQAFNQPTNHPHHRLIRNQKKITNKQIKRREIERGLQTNKFT